MSPRLAVMIYLGDGEEPRAQHQWTNARLSTIDMNCISATLAEEGHPSFSWNSNDTCTGFELHIRTAATSPHEFLRAFVAAKRVVDQQIAVAT